MLTACATLRNSGSDVILPGRPPDRLAGLRLALDDTVMSRRVQLADDHITQRCRHSHTCTIEDTTVGNREMLAGGKVWEEVSRDVLAVVRPARLNKLSNLLQDAVSLGGIS